MFFKSDNSNSTSDLSPIQRGDIAIIWGGSTRFSELFAQRQSGLREFMENLKAGYAVDMLLAAQFLESQLLPLGQPFQMVGTTPQERADNARQLLPLFQNQREFAEEAQRELLPDDPACARLIAVLTRIIGELERQTKEGGNSTQFALQGGIMGQTPTPAALRQVVQRGPKSSRRSIAKQMRPVSAVGSWGPFDNPSKEEKEEAAPIM